MDTDYSTILKLDEDFKNGLGIINPFISGLRTQTYVRLCRLWIDKLIHCTPHERQLRNIYLEQLCRHSEQQVLGPPFNCPPNEGPLQIIPSQFMVKQGVVLARPSSNPETSSWGDVSDLEDALTTTSCCSTVTWHAEAQVDPGTHSPIRRVASSTSTGAETVQSVQLHRRRFKRYVSVNFSKSKLQNSFRKRNPGNDSNDETFKDCFEAPLRSKSSPSKTKIVKKTRNHIHLPTKERIKENKGIGILKKRRSKKKSSKEEIEPVRDCGPGDKEVELVEMYNNATGVNPDQTKIKELEAKLQEMEKENSLLKEQIEEEKQKTNEKNSEMELLTKEVLGLRDKLLVVETMKDALEGEHKHAITGVLETVSMLLSRVDNAIIKNDQLEQMIGKMTADLKNKEVIDVETFSQMQKDWNTKYKNLEQEFSEKIKADRLHTVQTYECIVNDLKKEVSKKTKETIRLEKQLQEHCARMRMEVENIRCEMETSTKENAIKLNNKMYAYKLKVLKLLNYNKKIIENYEQKINALNKSKDMELWVQKLSIGSDSVSDKKQELENIVSALEEKFRKYLSDANQITLHRNEQKIKYNEIVANLENEAI